MRAFLDTSVLVAAFYADHEHHGPSLDLLVRHGRKGAGCGAYSLAEVYASLTSMPGKHRVSGDEALLYIGSIREFTTVVALSAEESLRALQEGARERAAGGATYDLLLAHCALKANAEHLYTWNVRHFQRFPSVADRVRTP
jgi:predicted nucleic acid-binding protein